ncbi:halogenase [Mycobacterium kubicae]|uniref:Halogenase n=1 Tax=Mycobacterium kubicae TaxID=120959 RepID=A0AAX1J9K1_9MYCO|nr:lycopene cyclase family protein [Mycobacterium kubicae]MCV7096173.1 tryptophan 7-halogenase [Mycobacterium kubicae]ORV95625.1 halogenase [Mycobacterium kubicae]QNI13719.1 halogenase [Mycobacterium kubicae]QPI37237.1 tryptophan 7-halogenase [Mycobacterium kubicae]GFG66667.1 halogenase [Mycobacterium kubicae]
MDARAQLSRLSPQAREALARRIKTHLSDAENAAPDYDVTIVGGGVAALTLARELRSARPRTRILIVEPTPHPVPEITHTVGESTVEISAHYLRDRIGLADHLHTSQLRKMGLRMFFSHNGNDDIGQRVELGSSRFIPQVTYQIDRGRLENELTRRCRNDGVEFAAGRVRSVDFGTGGAHTITIQTGDTTSHSTTRWVVDASGRNRALPRQLNLKRSNDHNCNAVWLRVAAELDIGRWSDDADWQERIVEGDRAMSTNHLMGEGYWVWLIRLASGSTSVGIVADPQFHSFDRFNTLAKARSWLAEHEPQCAATLAEHAHLIKDFRVMKNYSHSATKVYDGRQRWCLTGDSGVFLDPLYSSGLDLIAIGNGLITDMITRDLDGQDVTTRSEINDSLFRSLTDMWLAVYCHQYALMGSPAVMSAKVIWDIAFYWGFLGFVYSNGRFVTVADDPEIVPHLEGLIKLSVRMQNFFGEWAAVDSGQPCAKFVDLYTPLNFMVTLHTAMMGKASDFTAQFDANVRLLHQLAGQLVDTVCTEKSRSFADDHVVRQVQAWQADSYLRQLRSTYRQEQPNNPISQEWIVRTAPALAVGDQG